MALTVLSASADLSLITPAELEDLLGGTIDNVDANILAASILANEVAGYVLVSQTYLEELEPPSHEYLWLSASPVTEVQSVSVNDVALDAADYTVWPEMGALQRPEGWGGLTGGGMLTSEPWDVFQQTTIAVQYVAGFTPGASGDVPKKLKLAVAQIARALSGGELTGPAILERRIGDVTERYAEPVGGALQGLPVAAQAILLSYRRGW